MQNCHLCREVIEQVLKVDMNTIFTDYIRVLESAQIACRGKILNYNNDEPSSIIQFSSAPMVESGELEYRPNENIERIVQRFNHKYEMKNPIKMFENSQPSILYGGDKSDINLLGHSVISDLISQSPSPTAKKLVKEVN